MNTGDLSKSKGYGFMFGLNGKLTTSAEQRDTMVDLLLKSADYLRGLEGCHLYVIYTKPDEPTAIYVFEVWRSAEDHRGSLEHDAVKEVIAVARPMLVGAPEGDMITPLGGVGL
jgi:quinol monooxygenase YgiN